MAPDQKTCPNPLCGNEYPFDDEPPETAAAPVPAPPEPSGAPAGRAGRASSSRAAGPGLAPGNGAGGGSPLEQVKQYRAALVLVGVLVLIVGVGYLLFRVGMSYFEAGRPDPSTLPTATAGPVVVPGAPASPVPGVSPSPGTAIEPAASPSPAAPVSRLKVVNTEGQGANLRQRPSTTAPVLRTLPEGTVVEAIGGETNAEGRAWRNVRDQGGATGWVAAELLGPE